MTVEFCPVYAPFFGVLGCTVAIVFASFGAAYGTAKSGTGIMSMGVLHPEMTVKSTIPVVMAGIIAIYGLVVSVLISGGLKQQVSLYTSFIQLGAGLAVGLSGLAAGFSIGIVGDAGWYGIDERLNIKGLTCDTQEVLGLYGLIVALLLNTRVTDVTCG
ncbi:hypothetical protein PCK1_001636 [Pneumocystis canis]|nr:hypothetical protein PCK1_001636 [Pneumocystis canis]